MLLAVIISNYVIKDVRISMKVWISSVGLEELINNIYGYAFTRKTLSKLREENIIAQPEIKSDSSKKNGMRIQYPREALTDVLAYLLTCDTLRGLARGTKLKNKFSFFFAAKVIVDNYKAEQSDNNMQMIENFVKSLETDAAMMSLLSRNDKLSDITVKEADIVKVISVSLLFFSELIDGNFNNCLCNNWLRFQEVVVESGLGNDCFINNALVADNSKNFKKDNKQNMSNKMKQGVRLWRTDSEIIIRTLNYFVEFERIYGQEEQDNMIAWLDVIYTFDNNSRWLSKKVYGFFKARHILLPDDCDDNLFLYASLIKDIGLAKR